MKGINIKSAADRYHDKANVYKYMFKASISVHRLTLHRLTLN